jgi:iron complex outermembrane recepter protein
MRIGLILTVFSCWAFSSGYCQSADTVKQIDEVVIRGYLSRQPLVQVPASVAVLDAKDLRNGSQQTLLAALNGIPGIRMEERSPGSYRLSIRGSLLRSPFGIRNVKMYFNDLPFTDASGNAYLNLIDPTLLQRIEILKGPDGSLFGANSGGVVLMDSYVKDTTRVEVGISGGSYGIFKQHVRINGSFKRVNWSFGEAFQRSSGYRKQSAMRRLSLLGLGKLSYAKANSIKVALLFSDLHYQTPGALTEEEYENAPKEARAGAVEQHNGIYNKTFFGGITHETHVFDKLRHVISVFGTVTDFKNPFMTNFEEHDEKNAGFRTYFEYDIARSEFDLKLYAGSEGQWGKQLASHYDNVAGKKVSFFGRDTAEVSSVFYFARTTLTIHNKFTAEISASLNQYGYDFGSIGKRKPSNEWMPRLAVSYRFTQNVAVRGSLSRGYSPPTIAEIRPSTFRSNLVDLRAESGWNSELGVRFTAWNERVQVDASVFRFNLRDAIVRRTEPTDAVSFLNAGGTNQTGLECMLFGWLVTNQQSGIIRGMSLRMSYTYNHFRFRDYEDLNEDYSGNKLTGVPESNLVCGLTINFPDALSLFVQAITTSRIPLDDANTQYAKHYELLQARLSLVSFASENYALELFAGADNILNQKYSLGNDINAFGGRYYNAAPPLNFYGGINIKL